MLSTNRNNAHFIVKVNNLCYLFPMEESHPCNFIPFLIFYTVCFFIHFFRLLLLLIMMRQSYKSFLKHQIFFSKKYKDESLHLLKSIKNILFVDIRNLFKASGGKRQKKL